MALVKCTECGKKVSTKATTCPNCGAPPPKDRTGEFITEEQANKMGYKESRAFVKAGGQVEFSYFQKKAFCALFIILLLIAFGSSLPERHAGMTVKQPTFSEVIKSKYSAKVLDTQDIGMNRMRVFVGLKRKLSFTELHELSDQIYAKHLHYRTVFIFFLKYPWGSIDGGADGTARKVDGIKETPSLNW